MPVQLNHTIVRARDPEASAAFLSEVLGLGSPARYGPFHEVAVANDVSLDFMQVDEDIVGQHYAFLVSEEDFDAIFGRIRERGLEYFADPHATQPGEINTNDGGRGVYWADPDGHWLEILTRPYGSGT
jgi:catechol 2,3-dioxygenase-like lactoylglutathione lyase family enzyme